MLGKRVDSLPYREHHQLNIVVVTVNIISIVSAVIIIDS